MKREIVFRRNEMYDDKLADIREFNRDLADMFEAKREYFEQCLTNPPYRPSPGLNVERLEGKIKSPEWLKSYPRLHSFRVNDSARVIYWWTEDEACEYLFPFTKHYRRS
ncbi:hypothetical protein SY88_03320 [Clostridiales bacterium PH28_bin88]|nr:hypothetical protein SY88_03320 [Clostridiales bacterium PH28_bin88]